MSSEIVKYVPFQSTAEPSFWMKLGEHKLNTIKLNEDASPISASYGIVPSFMHRTTDDKQSTSVKKDPVPGRMRYDQDSVPDDDTMKKDDEEEQDLACVYNEKIFTMGKIIILNTIESFKNSNKNELLSTNCLGDLLRACGVKNNEDDNTVEEEEEEEEGSLDALATFLCLTHLDLKCHKVVYWFAFPVLVPAPGKTIRYASSSSDDADLAPQRLLKAAWGEEKCKRLNHEFQKLRLNLLTNEKGKRKGCPPFFMVIGFNKTDEKDSLKCIELSAQGYKNLSDEEKDSCTFAFMDPTTSDPLSSTNEPVGWALRNLIAYMTLKLNLAGKKSVGIISFRPSLIRRINVNGPSAISEQDKNDVSMVRNDASLLLQIDLPKKDDFLWPDKTDPNQKKTHYTCTGWELNARSRPGPRSVNLAPLLSPAHLAQQATDLNLKLMKWRMIPNLNLQLLSQTRVLLLGAGTLGCSVARTLLGWGVRHFQFIDNGKVSYSNPVRQNLFELKDCEQGGADKAIAAAEALKRIAGPTIESEGHVLTIPMPGHKIESKEEDKVRKDVEKMQELIDESDVVFLLTDTRESRWLPTVMARASNKMMINAALGLDSWLVMRHGGNGEDRLGCYFCNDIVAPENSTNNRTLDQQCTVTRPGLAPIASSMAVELMVALLHHDARQDAPAPKPSAAVSSYSPTVDSSSTATSPLGVMPHQIRGSVVSYTMMTPTVPAFRCCTGCSAPVIKAYKDTKFNFVKKVCCDPGSFLEDVSELSTFRNEAAQKMQECLDWEEDSQDGMDGDDDF